MPTELKSWKEIAAYLGVTVRTAQKWEHERDLPVRRLPGKRGLVSATLEDLESWRSMRAGEATAPLGSAERLAVTQALMPKSRLGRHVMLTLASCLVAMSAGAYWLSTRPGPPARIQVEQHLLIVTDHLGRECWRFVLPDTVDPGLYDGLAKVPTVWFGDFDEDGRTSVLFAQHPSTAASSASLWCFGQDGSVKWRFTPGRPVRTSKQVYAPYFHLRDFAVISSTHGKRVVLISHHYLS